jgi:RNA polymerase sigma-70 factor (ECF subfamily)
MSDAAEDWDWASIGARCKAEAMRILRRPHDAEEAAQEALARAWRSRHSCRTPDAPLPWCTQIARHEALRLVARRPNRANEETIEQLEVEDPVASGDGHRILSRIDVHRALEALTPHERLLIMLRYERDWSHAEIAAQLDIPEATARVRLHRAHKRLGQLL